MSMIQFVRAVAAGAGPHLRFARHLTIECDSPPSDSKSLNPDSSSFEEDCSDDEGKRKDGELMLLMEMFANDSLESFQWVDPGTTLLFVQQRTSI